MSKKKNTRNQGSSTLSRQPTERIINNDFSDDDENPPLVEDNSEQSLISLVVSQSRELTRLRSQLKAKDQEIADLEEVIKRVRDVIDNGIC